MKPRQETHRRFLLTLLLVALTGLVSTAQALQVQRTVTDLGGSFRYDFQVLNDDPDTYLIVSLVDAPIADPLIDASLTGPAGFLTSYDPGLGIVDLLADAVDFTPGGMFGPFSFDSLAAPDQAFNSFETLTLFGDFFAGDVMQAAVSTPSVLALIIGGLAFWGRLGATARRLRFSSPVSH